MKHRKAVFQGMKADIAGAPVSLAVGPLWWGGVPVSPPARAPTLGWIPLLAASFFSL